MQFIVIGRDGTDAGALERRNAARPAHLALCEQMIAGGQQLLGFALLDGAGKMNGSVMLFDVPARADLDSWLAREPYMTGKVWDSVEIAECRVGPPFAAALERARG